MESEYDSVSDGVGVSHVKGVDYESDEVLPLVIPWQQGREDCLFLGISTTHF
jgi:hypothetical protein